MSITAICIIVGVVLLVGFILASYVKAPPSDAFIISGLSKQPRVLIGKGGFRIPYFE
jgi:flotillin